MDAKKILLIQTAFLGDAILTTPLIRAVKQIFQNSQLDILVIPETKLIFQDNPHISNILLFDKRRFLNRYTSFISTLRVIRNNKYNLIISVHLSFSSSLFFLLSGCNKRLGFPRQKFKNISVDLPKGLPIVKRYLYLMNYFFKDEFSYQTELFWDSELDNKIKNFVREKNTEKKKLVGIAPGSVWPTKRWPLKYYAELIKKLNEHDVKCVLVGGKQDQEVCDKIVELTEPENVNTSGQFTILESAALIKELDLLVTNDSAPMHIANAVKTDVIAIFGPTVKRFGFFPFRSNDEVIEISLECRPCGKHGGKKCPQRHFKCMKDITPDVVFQSVIRHLVNI